MKLTHVAIKSGGKVYSLPKPNRHIDIEMKYNLTGEKGFLVDGKEFVNRTEGGKIALKNGQVKKIQNHPYLHSEDLW
jgi:hypothetical protein